MSVRGAAGGRAVQEAAGLDVGTEEGDRPIVQCRVVAAFPAEELGPLLRGEPERGDEEVSGAWSRIVHDAPTSARPTTAMRRSRSARPEKMLDTYPPVGPSPRWKRTHARPNAH